MNTPKPVKIIFDTDIGGDCDDAGALALLHRLIDRGEAELLAVTATYTSPHVAGCIDAINRWYGHTCPIGINYERKAIENTVYAPALCTEYENAWPEGSRAPDSLAVLRRTLASADDGSVTLVATGPMCNMARLVQSGPDAISPLTGRELIARKVARTVAMGGRFTGTWPMDIVIGDPWAGQGVIVTAEWNIKGDAPSAAAMCDLWPGELIFSSYEIGLYIVTMRTFARDARPDNPVRRAYDLHAVGRRGRESWDHTAMLEAIRPGAYWNLHPHGRIRVDSAGVTTWEHEAGGQQTYLLPRVDHEDIRQVIDEIVGR